MSNIKDFKDEIMAAQNIIRGGYIVEYFANQILDSIERYYSINSTWFYFDGGTIYISERPQISEVESLSICVDNIIAEMQSKVDEVKKAHNILMQKRAILLETIITSEYVGIGDVCDFYWDNMEEELSKAKPEIVLTVKARFKEFKTFVIQKMFDVWQEDFYEHVARATKEIRAFFLSVAGKKYESQCAELKEIVSHLHDVILILKEVNDYSVKEFLDNKQDVIKDAEQQMLPGIERKVEEFIACSKRACELPCSKMMDVNAYGSINSAYWNQVHSMSRVDAENYVSTCERYFAGIRVSEICAIDIEKLLRCVWFFAMEKPFSASDFQTAKSVFRRIYLKDHADIIIADLYAKKVLGGENSLCESVRYAVKNQPSDILTAIASGLMWMNAYQTEHMVLKHMLANGMEMSVKVQERLHALTNGGGNAPSGFDVNSSTDSFYFDVSALAWRDDEYVSLFENLAFRDKNLTYSLAIREENKELFIPQGINIPDTGVVVNKFDSVFSEEYGNIVAVRAVNSIALSGSGEEKLEGVMVSSGDCKQMGILIYIVKIGKKLSIKFYTLFVPNGSDLAMQKQQALSLYKKLSPSVTMWESSLKDTMLMAVEQLLNSSVQGNDTPTTTPCGGMGNEPIF